MPLAPAVLGALASYYGERPLDVRLFDPHPDFLELSFRIGKSLFLIAKSTHRIAAYSDLAIALEATDRIIYMPANSNRDENSNQQAPSHFNDGDWKNELKILPEDVHILNLVQEELLNPTASKALTGWPTPMGAESSLVFAFQILRWANGEDYPLNFLNSDDARPLHRWLDNPSALEY